MLQNLPPTAKLWLYQSNRYFHSDEVSMIEKLLHAFVADWQSHGSQLSAGFEILEHRFIAIAVDENLAQASGCSIDKSVSIVRALDEQLNCGFLDRGSISYVDGENIIQTLSFNKIKSAVETQQILPNTIVFNNNIDQLGLLETSWKVEAKDCWLNRYFSKSIVA